MKNYRGMTLIEILSAATILILLISMIYAFIFNGFISSERGVKNIDAIQEMSYVLHNIRADLQTVIEFYDDRSTFMRFEPADRSLKFTVVNGVDEKGLLIYSGVSYLFEGNNLVKRYYTIESGAKLGKQETIKISRKNIFKRYEFEICDQNGKPVSEDPDIRSKNPPRIIRSKIVHTTNSKLEVNLSLFSYYMKSGGGAGKFWLPCYKILPIEPRFSAVTSKGDIDIDIISNPSIKVTPQGIKIGGNM